MAASDDLNIPAAPNASVLQLLGRPDLRGATLYLTRQACGMCSMASIWNGIARIVDGAERNQVHKKYSEDRHWTR